MRAVKRAAPERVRSVARRVGGRRYVAAQRAFAEPELTVVIPVYNVEKYLPECLDSVLAQTLGNWEIIAVDDGSTDRCVEILEEYASRDGRIRVFRQTNSGQGIARNLAVTHARGDFVTFLDADDTVPPRAYEYMVRSLQETGSDFSVGSARRFTNNRYKRTPWARAVHEADRFGTTIDEFPDALQDIIACNRVFRTRFWVDKVGAFRGHIAYEDHVPMLTAYVRAEKFDILSGVTYNWRVREDQTSTGQQKKLLENLLDRIAVKEEANALLLAEASTKVYDAWITRALEVDFPAFTTYAHAGDEMYRNILTATFQTFYGRASDDARQDIRFYQKVRGWLISESRWDDLAAAAAYFRSAGQLPPTRAEDGRVFADLPDDQTFLDDAPGWVRELNRHETSFDGAVATLRWRDDRTVEMTGWALIRGLDATEEAPDTEVWLENTATGEKQPIDPERLRTSEASKWAGHFNAGYDRCGFGCVLDVGALLERGQPAFWTLRARVSHRGVVREGVLRGVGPGSAARLAPARFLGAGGDVVVRPEFHGEHGFGVAVTAVQVRAESLSVDPATRRVSGRIRVTGGALGRPRRVRLECDPAKLGGHAPLKAQPDGSLAFTLRLPATASSPDPLLEWVLSVDFPGEVAMPAYWSADEHAIGDTGSMQWRRNAAGHAQLLSDGPVWEVSGLEVTADEITAHVAFEGLTAADLSTVRLRNESTELAPTSVVPGEGDTATLRFDTRQRVLGGPRLPIRSGSYWLTVDTEDGRPSAARIAVPYQAHLPEVLRTTALNVRSVFHPPSRRHRLVVGPPLAEDEEGTTRWKSLQRDYRASDPAPADAVLLQCYRGEFATDSQLALHHGLRQARPDLTLFWGVSDLGTPLPDGAVPVVIGSRAWFDALASSRYLTNNIDFDGFFLKRPFQRYLQTFHGYPFKSMGISFWSGKDYSPERIGLEVARRNAEWDTILVPSEMCAEFYRREYSYTGDILVSGYPRDDFVVNADRDAVRREVLGRLGVAEDSKVVLYAPTYRDNLTTKTFAARIFDELDLVRLTELLGQDYVVLLRGHNNNQRELARVLAVPNVVDVTDYPEINELTVAADAAVLDYSSLRFDWALTGRPMVFFVPDLEDYFSSRPSLFPFEETAPGPLLRTTAEVASALRDLDGLSGRYGAEVKAFNERFNLLHDGRATERVIEAFFS